MPSIYLIQERESKKNNEHIYKIGRTQQSDPYMRIRNYPKGSEVRGIYDVRDCVKMEKRLLYLFKQQFRQVTEYGSEYFEGDMEAMSICIMEEVLKEKMVMTFNKHGEYHYVHDTLSKILPQAVLVWKNEMENQEH